ncbi:MAG TPA: type II secretion system protein [Anaerolinea thermolimosa]|uniref:Type II secretion system protein n=2 Tax=Anaerolinea thermolimosa TaxID=229919 RepID=A0A3D1JHU7_9CHLR|nr:type II secretion system protein [Anaerolinea thermolimosa]
MNFVTILIGVVALIIIGVAALVYIGLRNPQTTDERILQARLEEFNRRGEEVNLEKIELSLPFQERVIYPMARKLGEIAVKFTPQNALQSIARKLELAGSPGRLDPTVFLALQFIAAGTFGGILFLAITFGRVNWPIGQRFLIILGGTLLGFFFPQIWLTSRINRRQKEIRKAMPDALDLLTICVEAGLGFDAAMAKVAEKWESELSLAFARVIQEIQLGKIRREALRDMADRIGIPEMTSFVAAVIQSEQLGVSMAKVLRIQSDQMRVRRRQAAEEEAHKAPVKMLIPMALLIFPSLMITLMTPAALRLMNSALAGMFR